MGKSPPITSKFPSPPSVQGFTLAEVSIAMGIVSMGLLSLISLLALALDGVREASSNMVSSQIASGLIGELQSLPWDEIVTKNGTWSHFDASGQPVADAADDFEAQPLDESSYTAHVVIDVTRTFGRDVAIYIASASQPRARQQIQACLNGNSPAPGLSVFTSQLVRMEK